MPLFLTKPINISLGADGEYVKRRICKSCGISQGDLLSFRLHKKSVDARDKNAVRFVCSYVMETSKSPKNAVPYAEPKDFLLSVAGTPKKLNAAVVGAGPAGLFCALYLAKSGCKVTVVERGSDVAERKRKVEAFFNGGDLDVNCNVQFGLGGAGTFSDGKLTSGISSPFVHTVFKEFVRSGAPESVLTSALPHVGTDNLSQVIANLRDSIKKYGGDFLFDCKVTDFITENGKANGIIVEQNGAECEMYFDKIILACGHSARDTFETLHLRGTEMRFKPFAVGLRIEHTREFINTAQYGKVFASHRDLGAASYKLVGKCPDGRGCYSFCMCPGGVVVPSCSELNSVVVNGMSCFDRSDRNSNSAIVVTVSERDVESYGFGRDVFSGVRFQQYLEKRAFEAGGGNYAAPCQNVTDFICGRESERFDVTPSYCRGVKSVNLRGLLPESIGGDIALSLIEFDKKIRGFGSSGVLTGVETRTSSPVKILRDESFQSNLRNLYPVGEGAGYAGGIISSAVDGLRVAVSILKNL